MMLRHYTLKEDDVLVSGERSSKVVVKGVKVHSEIPIQGVPVV